MMALIMQRRSFPTGDWFHIQVNETWTRRPAMEIAERFRGALT
jgi:hypothetical protein